MRCEILTYARRIKKTIPDCREVCLQTHKCPVLDTKVFSPPEEASREPQKAAEQLKEKGL